MGARGDAADPGRESSRRGGRRWAGSEGEMSGVSAWCDVRDVLLIVHCRRESCLLFFLAA